MKRLQRLPPPWKIGSLSIRAALVVATRLGFYAHQEAEDLQCRALAGREAALGPDHLDTLASAHSLGLLRRAQGQLDNAGLLFLRALRGFEARWLQRSRRRRLASDDLVGQLLGVPRRMRGTSAACCGAKRFAFWILSCRTRWRKQAAFVCVRGRLPPPPPGEVAPYRRNLGVRLCHLRSALARRSSARPTPAPWRGCRTSLASWRRRARAQMRRRCGGSSRSARRPQRPRRHTPTGGMGGELGRSAHPRSPQRNATSAWRSDLAVSTGPTSCERRSASRSRRPFLHPSCAHALCASDPPESKWPAGRCRPKTTPQCWGSARGDRPSTGGASVRLGRRSSPKPPA